MKPSAKLYDLPAELVVRKPFALGRKKYAVGDTFEWQKDGIAPRRVGQMWDQRWCGTPGELLKDQERWAAKKLAEKAAIRSTTKTEKTEAVPAVEADIKADMPVPQVEAVAEPRRRGRPRRPPVTAEDLGL